MIYLKGKLTRNNPIRGTADLIRVPKKFLKPNKDVFLTMDIFFVDEIPFLMTLSRNIDFTATSHLPTQNSYSHIQIFLAYLCLLFKTWF